MIHSSHRQHLCVKGYGTVTWPGKHLQKTMERSTMLLMGSHQLFRLGHLKNSFLSTFTRPGTWEKLGILC